MAVQAADPILRPAGSSVTRTDAPVLGRREQLVVRVIGMSLIAKVFYAASGVAFAAGPLALAVLKPLGARFVTPSQ